MGQITANTCKHIIEYAERDERFPLTIWEQKQLAHAWLTLQTRTGLLREMHALVKDDPKYQGREHVSLGIAVTDAIRTAPVSSGGQS